MVYSKSMPHSHHLSHKSIMLSAVQHLRETIVIIVGLARLHVVSISVSVHSQAFSEVTHNK